MNSKIINGVNIYSYRWVILLLMCLACIVVNGSTLIFAGMAGLLLGPMGFDSQQFALLSNCAYLTGFLFCMLTGTMADRMGIRKVMVAGLSISALGAVIRIFTSGFMGMFLTSVLFGFGLAALNANSAKIIRLWFPGKTVGLAMGFYLCAATLGCAVAVPLAGMCTDVSQAFVGVAVLSVIAVVLWALFYKKHPENEQKIVEPVVKHLGIVLKSRNLWIACLVLGFIMAGGAINNGYLVAALSTAKGIDYTTATLVSSICNICASVGGLLFPTICRKTHNEKWMLVGLGAVVCVFVGVYWFTMDGMATAVGVAAASILVGGTLPLSKALPAQLPDIQKEHMGAAGGLHATIQNAFAFIIPSYIVAPICGLDYNALQVSYIVLMALATICAVFLPKLVTTDDPVVESAEKVAA
jgi:cyanate permease